MCWLFYDFNFKSLPIIWIMIMINKKPYLVILLSIQGQAIKLKSLYLSHVNIDYISGNFIDRSMKKVLSHLLLCFLSKEGKNNNLNHIFIFCLIFPLSLSCHLLYTYTAIIIFPPLPPPPLPHSLSLSHFGLYLPGTSYNSRWSLDRLTLESYSDC